MVLSKARNDSIYSVSNQYGALVSLTWRYDGELLSNSGVCKDWLGCIIWLINALSRVLFPSLSLSLSPQLYVEEVRQTYSSVPWVFLNHAGAWRNEVQE